MSDLILSCLQDPLFYAAAIPAVLVTGASKSGFGGIALLAVPLLSLYFPPSLAIAAMLPLLLAMDAMGVMAWRKQVCWGLLWRLIPGALVGIAIGVAMMDDIDDDAIRLMVGTIAVIFCLHRYINHKRSTVTATPLDGHITNTHHPAGARDRIAGSLWGSLAGFTSAVAHAGSPPYHVYILPKKLPPSAFAATGVWFFALVNLAKLPAYLSASLITMEALWLAVVLLPLVPIGFWLGLWLNRRMDHQLFYRIIYGAVFLTGVKLLYDGSTTLI